MLDSIRTGTQSRSAAYCNVFLIMCYSAIFEFQTLCSKGGANVVPPLCVQIRPQVSAYTCARLATTWRSTAIKCLLARGGGAQTELRSIANASSHCNPTAGSAAWVDAEDAEDAADSVKRSLGIIPAMVSCTAETSYAAAAVCARRFAARATKTTATAAMTDTPMI